MIYVFTNVVSRATSDSLIKHLHFSLNNVRLRLKQNKQPLDMQIEGVAFPSNLFNVHSWPTDGIIHDQNDSQLELWSKFSEDITLCGCFKCSLSKSYLLSSRCIILCLCPGYIFHCWLILHNCWVEFPSSMQFLCHFLLGSFVVVF